ncbi:MAG: hypothetical protein M3Y37_00130, partial [Chloroflexota bacterium]|nr:hypothetical protein [Chloroflexota bacterium]
GYASPKRCLTERSDLFEDIDGVEDMEEADDLDWPETDPDARAALYRYEYENPDTGDTGVFVQYFECRDLLMNGDPIEDVVLTFDMGIEEESYEDVLPVWEEMLASIEWDAEGATDPGQGGGSTTELEPGLSDGAYLDANDGWAVTWDDSVLTGEEWIASEDGDVAGVQLTTDTGNFLTIFAMEASSLRQCVTRQIEVTEGSQFTDFEEVDDVDLPQTSDEGRAALYQGIYESDTGDELDIYLYSDCRPLILGGEEDDDRFLVASILSTVDQWEDELPIWSEVLTAIEFDAGATNGGSGGSATAPGNMGDGLGDGIYEDPSWGFSVSWRASQYAPREMLNDDDEPIGVSLSTGGGVGSVSWGEYASADECVQAQVDDYGANDGVTEYEETDELELPASDPDATGVLYTYIWSPDSDIEDPYVRYMECRPMILEGEPVEGVFLIVLINIEADAYKVVSSDWEEILATIEFS